MRLPAMRIVTGFLLIACAGCGRSTNPHIRPIYPTRGKLTFSDNSPVRHAIIHLDPVDSAIGNEASGIVKADGTFEIRTYSNTSNDGAVLGEYKVSIEPYTLATIGKVKEPPSTIPKRYQTGEESGLTVTIRPEENYLNFVLQK
jgi:hypothetical protein